MRRIGDRDGEYQIFMKRVNYDRTRWAKGVFGIIGGALAVGFGASALTVAGITYGGAIVTGGSKAIAAVRAGYGVATYYANQAGWALYAAAIQAAPHIAQTAQLFWQTYRTYGMSRIALNAIQQAYHSDEGWRGVDVISAGADGLPMGTTVWRQISYWLIGSASPIIEYRPFSKDKEKRFRSVFYNKSFSETMYDVNNELIRSGIYRFGIAPSLGDIPENAVALPYDYISREIVGDLKDNNIEWYSDDQSQHK